MMANLLESIREHFHPELIGRSARLLNESEGGISKALGGLAPTLLAALLEKTELTTADIAGKTQLRHILFGARLPAVIHALAAFSGVRADTVPALLDVVEPVLVASIRQKADAVDTSGLSALLQSEKDDILGKLPAGMASILGLGIADNPRTNTASASWREMFWPLLLLAGLGGGILVYLKYC